ncbi:hypothetical protein JCM6882_006819 [Rhodosporidiobolus microsporus]
MASPPTQYAEHPSTTFDTPLAPPGHLPRAVILGQHPTRVTALAALFNEDEVVRIVAGCSDILDCGVILNAQIPKVDLLICGGYFELQDVQDMLAEVANDGLRLLKVPDGVMMEGGGPPAVRDWIYEQIRKNQFTISR